MIIGVLKEIKPQEHRVALTPDGARALAAAGHSVIVQRSAGLGSGFDDGLYGAAGARLEDAASDICRSCDLILKIKEPQPQEYGYFRPGQLVFTFFHFASSLGLTQAMLASGAVCIGYETVQTDAGELPLLAPMSRIAGKMAPLVASVCLARPWGGKGLLPCPTDRAPGARFVILGGGTAGQAAAEIASGIGAGVVIMDTSPERIDQLRSRLPGITCTTPDRQTLESLVPRADVLIGAAHSPGARAPKLISRALVRRMEPGSVVIDIAIDQGGCIETSRPTTHGEPTYVEEGVIHYCVTNMPGVYPRTATLAITGAAFPYVLKLAERGLDAKLEESLLRGLNIYRGKLANRAVAQAFGLPWVDRRELIRAGGR